MDPMHIFRQKIMDIQMRKYLIEIQASKKLIKRVANRHWNDTTIFLNIGKICSVIMNIISLLKGFDNCLYKMINLFQKFVIARNDPTAIGMLLEAEDVAFEEHLNATQKMQALVLSRLRLLQGLGPSQV
ncbi:hypothetical protein KR018_000637 [Drosophila ironensis]|nr:hypothetical protein KR018_000637 [Drosophila ironensis]